jgi:hypothetical protein
VLLSTEAEAQSMTSEALTLRAQAARCLRLANGGLSDEVSGQLRAMAAEYLEKAQALERAEDHSQQQQQIGNVGAVAGVVGIEGGVVSEVFNLESSGVEAPDRRPRHEQQYHEG